MNSSGRATASVQAVTPSATSAAASASPPPSPKIEPNSVRATWMPAPPPAPMLNSVRKKTPKPSTNVNTVPIAVSSAAELPARAAHRAPPARRPRAPIPMPTSDRRGEQADALVHSRRSRRQRTREGDVTERVAREHLSAQHHEPAAHAARQRDERAREQRIAHEFLAEHQAITPPSDWSRSGPVGAALRREAARAQATARAST